MTCSLQLRPRVPVLVADDDPNDGVLLELAFAKCGLQPDLRFVRDGEAAIAYLSGAAPYEDRQLHPSPRLLLLDLRMPRVDGLEVLEWLNHQAHPPEMFVVVMSGSEDPSDITLSYAFGADACLPKPCDPSKFAAMVAGLTRFCVEAPPPRKRRARGRYTWPDNLFAIASGANRLGTEHHPAA